MLLIKQVGYSKIKDCIFGVATCQCYCWWLMSLPNVVLTSISFVIRHKWKDQPTDRRASCEKICLLANEYPHVIRYHLEFFINWMTRKNQNSCFMCGDTNTYDISHSLYVYTTHPNRLIDMQMQYIILTCALTDFMVTYVQIREWKICVCSKYK